jgi:hypothetical protein
VIAGVLSGRPWLRLERPFPHVVARDVFEPGFYGALDAQIRAILARGLSETPAAGRFARSLPGYDAYGLALAPGDGPAGVLLEPGWRDLLADLWGVERMPYVFAGAHHHAPGGRSGFIHNDFNPVWFPRAGAAAIRTPDEARCAYKTGAGSLAGDEKVQVVRGAVVILYVANDPWQDGDGGETGLYASADARIDRPDAVCPPESNTLVSFECTPRSFHGYLASRRRARTSLIMWVHRPLAEARARYGAGELERWKS